MYSILCLIIHYIIKNSSLSCQHYNILSFDDCVCIYSGSVSLSPPEPTGVSTTIIIIVVVVVVVALIIFIIAVLIAIYCLCFRDSGKAGNSPHRRTFSFRSKHWTDSSGAHSMPRGDQQTRKDVSVITILVRLELWHHTVCTCLPVTEFVTQPLCYIFHN